jgi:hypothetical protein
VTLPLEFDGAEQVFGAVERVTGVRAEGCPWSESRDPFVQAVMSAHPHWTRGELGTRWGGAVPEALMRGVEIFDRAINAIQNFDIRQSMKQSAPQTQPSQGVRITRAPAHAVRRGKPT